MSAGSINSSGGLTSSSTLTNGGVNGALQITGLGTGINTNAIIQAEMAVKEQPLTAMQNQISGLTTEAKTLQSIQSGMQTVSLDALALGLPSLYFPVQTIGSSNTALVSAQTNNGVGAPIGSMTLAVTQLASAAQATYDYTSPATDDTLTFDNGQTLTVTANTTAAGVASQINHSNSLDVWASVVTDPSNGNTALVLSSRTTGQNNSFSPITNGGATLASAATNVQAGQDAGYSINGGATQYSASDTVVNAIPDVTLTLEGVTAAGSPVTITTQPPGPNQQSITAAVQQFVSDYNNVVQQVESAVNAAPASESNPSAFNPNSGSLFGDDQLESILNNLRQMMYTPMPGLPTGLAALSDIGISTGISNGQATASAVQGLLTVDTTALSNALTANPSGVQAMLTQWSQGFQTYVNAQSYPGGTLDARIQGNSSMINTIQSQYTTMQALFQQQQADMEQQWAKIEATINTLHSQGSTFSTFASSLKSTSSSSSSGG